MNISKLVLQFIYSKFFVGLSATFLTWILRNIYDKRFKVRPRLYIYSESPLFSQRRESDFSFKFGWSIKIKIKNISKYTAQNIEIIFPEGYELSNVKNLKRILTPNIHLEPYKEIEMDLDTFITSPANTIEENGNLVIIPGSGILNPRESLKPNKINNIKLSLKYRNEENKVFFTKFIKIKERQNNHFTIFKPYFFQTLFKWKQV